MEEARTPVTLGPQAHARLWSRLYEHPGSWPSEVGIPARAETTDRDVLLTRCLSFSFLSA